MVGVGGRGYEERKCGLGYIRIRREVELLVVALQFVTCDKNEGRWGKKIMKSKVQLAEPIIFLAIRFSSPPTIP